MASALKNWVRKSSSLLTPSGSSTHLRGKDGVSKAAEGDLFTKVDPAVDGEDCDHDCASCTIKYPSKFSIEERENLYGHVKGWSTHLIVATGKTDWVRDVADEKGSVMEAVDRSSIKPTNGRLMLSASDIPIPDYASDRDYSKGEEPTSVILLPAFAIIDHVTPNNTSDLIKHIISTAPTNTTSLPAPGRISSASSDAPEPPAEGDPSESGEPETLEPTTIPEDLPFKTRPCPHDVLILMCSQKTRDVRCGQSAPLLRKEFERHLRPLGLYRDAHDERPGGVGIYFISHVGGHKFSANVMVYRRAGIGAKAVVEGGSAVMQGGKEDQVGGVGEGEGTIRPAEPGEAAQCIWLARVRPEDCEGIVKFTVLQGKVVKPERQLRGGFDREKGLVSW